MKYYNLINLARWHRPYSTRLGSDLPETNLIQERSDKREPKVASGYGLKQKKTETSWDVWQGDISFKKLRGLHRFKDRTCFSLFLILPIFCWGVEFSSLWDRTYQRVGTKLFDSLPFLVILSLKSLGNKLSWATEYRKTKDMFLKMLKIVRNQGLRWLFDSLESFYIKQIQQTLPFRFQHCSQMWRLYQQCQNWFFACQGTWINCPKLFRSATSDPAGSRNCLWADTKDKTQRQCE